MTPKDIAKVYGERAGEELSKLPWTALARRIAAMETRIAALEARADATERNDHENGPRTLRGF